MSKMDNKVLEQMQALNDKLLEASIAYYQKDTDKCRI